MKEVCLVRHAKSSWKYPKLDDFERPLNKRGRKNAPFMGKIIHLLRVAPDLIISSPATRAAMTARILAHKIDYPLEEIRYVESVYESSEMELVHILKNLEDQVNKVMLIGHNPALTQIANTIGNYPITNIPTSGICCVALDITSWSGIDENPGKLKFFEFPKKHV